MYSLNRFVNKTTPFIIAVKRYSSNEVRVRFAPSPTGT